MEAAGEFCIADHLVFPDDWQVMMSQGGPRIPEKKMEVAPDPMGENKWGLPRGSPTYSAWLYVVFSPFITGFLGPPCTLLRP